MSDKTCHCGQPIHYGYTGNPTDHRGMCAHCDDLRCDTDPGACKPSMTLQERIRPRRPDRAGGAVVMLTIGSLFSGYGGLDMGRGKKWATP